jgi:L-ascorbate metabolism protein UlaG (beta-lactamase superfamily)
MHLIGLRKADFPGSEKTSFTSLLAYGIRFLKPQSIICPNFIMAHSDSKSIRKVFENLSHTPQFGEGYNMLHVLKAMLRKPPDIIPPGELPAVRTDLKQYVSQKPAVIWFGHSSYLIHYNGFNILVDPVLSGSASPLRFQFRAFKGADLYKPADMPPIDCLILTHNHYDHLDYRALRQLQQQTKAFVMPLHVGRSLAGLHIPPERIRELNWWQGIRLTEQIQITATPARHFSGRGLRRNGSLWASYVLQLGAYQIFIGGDSGYDHHFKEIGQRFGPFDLALLECGQYNVMWPYIHSMPEELVTEGQELGARVVMPVHWGKFALSNHAWQEPVQRFVAAAEQAGMAYTTPMIGEPVVLDGHFPKEKWWKRLE